MDHFWLKFSQAVQNKLQPLFSVRTENRCELSIHFTPEAICDSALFEPSKYLYVPDYSRILHEKKERMLHISDIFLLLYLNLHSILVVHFITALWRLRGVLRLHCCAYWSYTQQQCTHGHIDILYRGVAKKSNLNRMEHIVLFGLFRWVTWRGRWYSCNELKCPGGWLKGLTNKLYN